MWGNILTHIGVHHTKYTNLYNVGKTYEQVWINTYLT
jgi:hypothetical protein